MLNSLGLFKNAACPYYVSGLCERPYCMFRHCMADLLQAKKDAQRYVLEDEDFDKMCFEEFSIQKRHPSCSGLESELYSSKSLKGGSTLSSPPQEIESAASINEIDVEIDTGKSGQVKIKLDSPIKVIKKIAETEVTEKEDDILKNSDSAGNDTLLEDEKDTSLDNENDTLLDDKKDASLDNENDTLLDDKKDASLDNENDTLLDDEKDASLDNENDTLLDDEKDTLMDDEKDASLDNENDTLMDDQKDDSMEDENDLSEAETDSTVAAVSSNSSSYTLNVPQNGNVQGKTSTSKEIAAGGAAVSVLSGKKQRQAHAGAAESVHTLRPLTTHQRMKQLRERLEARRQTVAIVQSRVITPFKSKTKPNKTLQALYKCANERFAKLQSSKPKKARLAPLGTSQIQPTFERGFGNKSVIATKSMPRNLRSLPVSALNAETLSKLKASIKKPVSDKTTASQNVPSSFTPLISSKSKKKLQITSVSKASSSSNFSKILSSIPPPPTKRVIPFYPTKPKRRKASSSVYSEENKILSDSNPKDLIQNQRRSPIIESHALVSKSAKAPTFVRQCGIDQLFDTFIAMGLVEDEAFEKAIQEEDRILNKASGRGEYSSIISNIVYQLRMDAGIPII